MVRSLSFLLYASLVLVTHAAENEYYARTINVRNAG